MGSFGDEILRGWRSLGRSPMFVCAFVVALTVAIGATISVFSVLDSIILRTLPAPKPNELVQISGEYRNHSLTPLSYPMFAELAARQQAFSDICGWSIGSDSDVEIGGTVVALDVRSVTSSYYSMLGARPFLGRLINADDFKGSRASQVVVIGYDLWRDRFNSNPKVLGQTVRISGEPFTIVGVTERWFPGMTTADAPALTVPVGAGRLMDLSNRALLWLFATGRLKSGEQSEQALAQLNTIWGRLLETTVPTESRGQRRKSFLSMGVELRLMATGARTTDDLRSRLRQPLDLLFSIAALILLVISVNLTSLTLTRVNARSHEVATRIALGARPWQASRSIMIETLTLSLLSALAALALSYWGSQLLAVLVTYGRIGFGVLDVRPDWRVLLVALASAAFAASVTSVIPAWQCRNQDLTSSLRAGSPSVARRAGVLSKALIVAQVGISLVLVQCAGLFLRTLRNLEAFNPGFDTHQVIEFELSPNQGGDHRTIAQSYRQLLVGAIAALPGVQSVSLSNAPVLSSDYVWKDTVTLPGQAETIGSPAAALISTAPGYLSTVGIPLRAGREFSWTDDPHHPSVAIIDENLARELFGSQNPVDRLVSFGVQPNLQNLQVVGVSAPARLIDIRDGRTPSIFVASEQQGFAQDGQSLLVRGSPDGSTVKEIENKIESFNYEHSSGAGTVASRNDKALANEKAIAALSSVFALVALLVAALGLFCLLSYSISLRTREIGIRMAMGSQKRRIFLLVFRQALALTAIGIGLGLPCALAVSRIFSHMLFSISFTDPTSILLAACTLSIVGLIAGGLPAMRATRIEPLAALRQE
jgi:predicted permease